MSAAKKSDEGSDGLCTPDWIVELIDGNDGVWGCIDLDPCWNANAITMPNIAWTKRDNCFAHDSWAVRGEGTRIFMNPPYSNPAPFVSRLAIEVDGSKCEAMLLVKHDHSTGWWRSAMATATAVAMFHKRVDYLGGPRRCGSFASSMIYMGPDVERFCNVFRKVAYVAVPARPPASFYGGAQ